jgi:hypothetical protein
MAGQKARSTGTDYQQPTGLRLAALCYGIARISTFRQEPAAELR